MTVNYTDRIGDRTGRRQLHAREIAMKRPACHLLAALVVLTGCSTPRTPSVETTGMPNAELALQTTIRQVDTDLTQIGAISTSQTAADPENAMPDELRRPVDFVWRGTLDDGAQKIADTIGYRCVIVRDPGTPKLQISVNIAGAAIDVLHNLGDRAGNTATIAVDPLHRQIQVIYHA